MPCGAGVHAPHHGRLVLEDGLGLDRVPVAGEGAVAGGVFDGTEQFVFLDERAAGAGSEFGQLFVGSR